MNGHQWEGVFLTVLRDRRRLEQGLGSFFQNMTCRTQALCPGRKIMTLQSYQKPSSNLNSTLNHENFITPLLLFRLSCHSGLNIQTQDKLVCWATRKAMTTCRPSFVKDAATATPLKFTVASLPPDIAL